MDEPIRMKNDAGHLWIRWSSLFIFLLILGVIGLGLSMSPNAHASSGGFATRYQQAQQKGWKTGTWGTAPYYIDSNNNMYVGKGELQSSFYNATGSVAGQIHSITFSESVQAPANSNTLFSGTTWSDQPNHSLTMINGMEKLDTTNMTSMSNMFSNDQALQSVDLSTWYTPNLKDISCAFLNDSSLSSADLSGWDTSQVTNGASLLSGDSSLKSVDVSNWDTSNMQDMSYMFNNVSSIESLDLDSWHTPSASNMSYMFNGDFNLKRLAIYNLDTMDMSKNINGMFSGDGLFFISIGNNFRVRNEESLSLGVVGNNQSVYNDSLPAQVEDLSGDLFISGVNSGTWYSTSNSASFNSGATYPNADESMWSVVGDNQAQSWGTYNIEDLPAPYNVDQAGDMNVGNGTLKGMNLQQLFKGNQGIIKSIHINAPAKTRDDSSHSNENEGSEWDNWSSGMQDGLFANTSNATYMDLRELDVSTMYNLNQTFANDNNLNTLDISTWNTGNKAQNDMFANDSNMTDLYLGSQTQLKPESHLPDGTWHNYETGQTLSSAQLTDGNSHPGHWRQPQFIKYFRDAQRRGWKTGYWGTAPWYLDDSNQMHVGSGNLMGPLYDTTGKDTAKSIPSISFDEPVKAPADSSSLLSTSDTPGDASSLTDIENLNALDTSSAQNLASMFANDTVLGQLDISSLNTSRTTDMSYMFANDRSMTDLDANGIDTSHVTTLQSIFFGLNSLKNINVADWNVQNVQNMDYAFYNVSSLGNLDVDDWTPTNVHTMNGIFANDASLRYFDLSHWDPEQVTDLDNAFINDQSADFLNLHSWRTPRLVGMGNTFQGMSGLKNLDIGNFDTSNVSSMQDTFPQDQALDQLTLNPKTSLKNGAHLPGIEWQDNGQVLSNDDLANGQAHPGFWQQTAFSHDYQQAQKNGWLTSRWGTAPYYIDDQHNMYVGSGKLLSNLDNNLGDDTARTVRTINLEEPVQAPENSSFLFSPSNLGKTNDTALTNINGLDQVDMSHADDIDDIFASDHNLDHLDLSSWDISHVNRMQFAFYNTFSLTDLNVSNWNTQNVNNMYSAFSGAGNLNELNVKDWDTSQVNKMQYVFYSDSGLDHLDLSGWRTDHDVDMTGMFGNDDQLSHLNLGAHTALHGSMSLDDGLWQNGTTDLTLAELSDGNSRPGSWNHIPLQNDNDLWGSEYDDLTDLIQQRYGINRPDQQIQIIKDDHSLNGDRLNAGEHDNVIYAVQNNTGQTTFYHVRLHVIAYTNGDDIQGNVGRSLTDVLNEHYHTSSVKVEDDGGSQNNDQLNVGDYRIRYRYQDSMGNTQYKVSHLHDSYHSSTALPYLIVDDHPSDELLNVNDLQSRLTDYWGMDKDSHLSLTTTGNDTADYTLTSGQNVSSGNVKVIPTLRRMLPMGEMPSGSDSDYWNGIIDLLFSNDNGVGLTAPTINESSNDTHTGQGHVQGVLYPNAGQFANSPAVPYDISVNTPNEEYSVNNNIDDQQVHDVIQSISSDSQVISVTDGQGNDVTPSRDQLSTLKDPTNLTLRLKVANGYANLHLASVSDLIEPNVDINVGDWASQIQAQTHESDFRNFGVDDTKDISPTVQQVDYHFVKDVQAQGDHVQTRTKDLTVTGTAYVHSNNVNPSSPTFTLVEGMNPVQHIESTTGHSINMTQTPDGQDINNLPVGSYHVAYQYTDDNVGATNNANIIVIPNYYFSSVTNDSSFDSQDPDKQAFAPNDYQHNGNYYKSVVDTSDHSSNDQNGHNSNNSNNGNQDYVDGLHTQDGKVAHFNSKNPYLK